MTKPLEGKIALVTGAGRGIGRATAERLAADGALVAVHYSSSEAGARETLNTIEGAGGRGFLVQGDVATREGRAALFDALDRELTARVGANRFDILVNNAGVADPSTLEDMTEEVFDRQFDVNVKGLTFVTQAASPRLNDGGRIVNLSSVVTRVGFPMYAAYAPSKGAVDVLTRVLAAHFGPRGITVNAVAPGAIETDMYRQGPGATPEGEQMLLSLQAFKRLGQPSDIAAAIAALVRPDAGWITGQWVEVSGGTAL